MFRFDFQASHFLSFWFFIFVISHLLLNPFLRGMPLELAVIAENIRNLLLELGSLRSWNIWIKRALWKFRLLRLLMDLKSWIHGFGVHIKLTGGVLGTAIINLRETALFPFSPVIWRITSNSINIFMIFNFLFKTICQVHQILLGLFLWLMCQFGEVIIAQGSPYRPINTKMLKLLT